MRKLTSKEVAGLCVLLGTCSAGGAHACIPGVACTLPPVTVTACFDCTLLPYEIEYIPPSAFLPSFVHAPPFSIPGGPVGDPVDDPNCGKTTVSATGNSTIQNFVRNREGRSSSVESETRSAYGHPYSNETGYLPPDNSNAASPGSGATFCGVDAGQYYGWQLTNMGVDPATIENISPYLVQRNCRGQICVNYSPKGGNAQALLATLTNDGSRDTLYATQCQNLFLAVFGSIENNLETWFQNSGTGVTFAELPTQAQTAIMDYAFSNGDGYLGTTGTVAQDLLHLDWADLEAYWAGQAQNGKDDRAGLRAQKLANDLKSGELPPQGKPKCA